jgi:hypothetical protein
MTWPDVRRVVVGVQVAAGAYRRHVSAAQSPQCVMLANCYVGLAFRHDFALNNGHAPRN